MTELKRDDGTPVEVDFELESAGEANFDHPGHICDGGGDGPIWLIAGAFNTAGEAVELTQAERDRFEAWACENLEPPEYEPQDDDYF